MFVQKTSALKFKFSCPDPFAFQTYEYSFAYMKTCYISHEANAQPFRTKMLAKNLRPHWKFLRSKAQQKTSLPKKQSEKLLWSVGFHDIGSF